MSEPKEKLIGFRVTENLYDRLVREAAKEDRTMSNMIVQLLKLGLQTKQQGERIVE